MSYCLFIASDSPLPEYRPPVDYPLHIDVNKGTVYDGDADDPWEDRYGTRPVYFCTRILG